MGTPIRDLADLGPQLDPIPGWKRWWPSPSALTRTMYWRLHQLAQADVRIMQLSVDHVSGRSILVLEETPSGPIEVCYSASRRAQPVRLCEIIVDELALLHEFHRDREITRLNQLLASTLITTENTVTGPSRGVVTKENAETCQDQRMFSWRGRLGRTSRAGRGIHLRRR